MKKIFARVANSKITWTAAALLLLYTFGGFLLAPYLLERNLPRYIEERVGQQASIGNVRINPYLFILELSDFQLDGMDDSAMLKLKLLYVDFSLSSIFRRAWVFDDLHVDGVRLQLEIDREGRLNIMDVVERLKTPEPTDEPPPRLIFEHIAVSDSIVHVNDLSGETLTSNTFGPINLELMGFSTIPEREGRYSLAAKLPAGGTIEWKGSLSLFPLASSGAFEIEGMKLATAWEFLRDELRMARPGGELALAGRYSFSHQQGNTTLEVDELQAQISDLAVALPGGSPELIALDSIRITGARFTLGEKELVVSGLSVSDGKLSASLASDGTLNWQRLVKTNTAAPDAEDGTGRADTAKTDKAEDASSGQQAWRVRVEKVRVEKVALGYTDHTFSPALVFGAKEINSSFELEAATGGEAPRVVVEDMQLAVSKAAVAPIAADDATPVATLDLFSLTGARFDTGARVALVPAVTLGGGDMAIMRNADGPAGLLQLLPGPAPDSKQETVQPDRGPAGPVEPDKAPWKYQVGSVELKQFDVHLVDRSFEPAISYEIDVVSATLRNVDSASESPIVFATELMIGESGAIDASGTMAQDFEQAHAKLDVRGVRLEPLDPFVARYAAVDLKSGSVTIAGELDYRSATAPTITAKGSASVNDVRLTEAGTEERLVSWKSLSTKNVALSFSPDRLEVGEVHLVEPGMKLVIDEDRNVNLVQILKNNGSAPARQKQSPGKPAPDQGADSFTYGVDRIRIAKGSLDFADLSLVLPFSTRVHSVDGSIVGISSVAGSRAELDLGGQVEEYGEASAAGALIPGDPKKFLDIKADFDNIALPPLSPYSATFAGRKIAAGDLRLDLNYKVVDGHLEGENGIVLTDFKLGERVEAPSAMDLPLDLAIALLKSPDGRIKIAVPVEGDLGNPRFDYGTVIRGAIANVIRRVVTSPFRLLGGLLGGGGGEELSKVEFEPGSDSVDPAEREKLDNLAQALKQRPQIGLTVHGTYDVERDGERLRSELTRRDLAIAMGAKLEPGEDPGLIAYGDPDSQKALEKMLDKQAGKNAVSEFAEEYAKRTGKEPDRVNPLLGLFGRGSEDRDFYAALFERLTELQPPLDDALQSLAENRARAVIDVLVEEGIDRNRLAVGSIKRASGKPGTPVAAELSLEAAPSGSAEGA